jgi:3D (Asp-Asp-Asp) domain-containing protein
MLKINRLIFAIFAILLGLVFGLYLGTGYKSAKAMDYNINQAMEMLVVPMEVYQQDDVYQPDPEPELPEPEIIYLGQFTTTAYCHCEVCCGKWANPSDPKTASGTIPAEGITVGTDWGELEPGTRIYIKDVGERIVEDKTADWVNQKYSGKILDLYFFDHSDALAFGKKTLDVWMIQ